MVVSRITPDDVVKVANVDGYTLGLWFGKIEGCRVAGPLLSGDLVLNGKFTWTIVMPSSVASFLSSSKSFFSSLSC